MVHRRTHKYSKSYQADQFRLLPPDSPPPPGPSDKSLFPFIAVKNIFRALQIQKAEKEEKTIEFDTKAPFSLGLFK